MADRAAPVRAEQRQQVLDQGYKRRHAAANQWSAISEQRALETPIAAANTSHRAATEERAARRRARRAARLMVAARLRPTTRRPMRYLELFIADVADDADTAIRTKWLHRDHRETIDAYTSPDYD